MVSPASLVQPPSHFDPRSTSRFKTHSPASTHHSDLVTTQFQLTESLRSLQALGLGRSAMAQVEHFAALPPLNGTIIALDTIDGDLQLREESLHAFYDLRGLERPKVLRSNESWYLSQGYSQIARVGNGTTWTNPVNGEMSSIPIFYMTKPLVK